MWNSYYGSYEEVPLSGCQLAHTWVDTGTKVTWCKVCNTDGHYDGTLCKYVVTTDRIASYIDMD